MRGKDFFDRIVRDVGEFIAYQQRDRRDHAARLALADRPQGDGRRNCPSSSASPHEMGVREVHLQRLVFDEHGYGMARAEQLAVRAARAPRSRRRSTRGGDRRELGVTLDASGATEPGLSLKRQTDDQPWSTCRRPWSLMYFTAHGRALPCCIAPFSARGYDSYTLGDATQQTLREIWNSPAYQDFRAALLSDAPPEAVPELRPALEPVSCAWPASSASSRPRTRQGAIGRRHRAIAARGWCETMIVVDGGSTDGTATRPAPPAPTSSSTRRARLRPGLRRRRGGGRRGLPRSSCSWTATAPTAPS